MAYYLSQRNKKILAPYLRLLEVSEKDLTFNTSQSEYMRTQFRNAFNTTHPHLKDLWRMSISASTISFYKIATQLSLEINNVVSEPVSLFQIAQAILDGNVPIKYLSAQLSQADVDSLTSLAEAKSLRINFNSPELEIIYG